MNFIKKKFMIAILISSHICYLERAINSVLNQKETNIIPDIFINVNTLDKTFLDQVKKLIKKYKKINIIVSKSNGRPGKGHNSSLKLFQKYTEYDYMIMLDGDDLFYPYAFHQFEKCFEQEPNLDLLHLMLNDKITYNDISNQDGVKIFGNFKFYSNNKKSNNWWENNNLENPFINKIYECRTPTRILLVSRNIFNSDIPIKYCEKSRLFDDFLTFLCICENEFNKKLNIFVLSDTNIYFYNANNDESVTYNFDESQYDDEQKYFDENKNNYPNIKKNWDFYKEMNYIQLTPPNNFDLNKKIELCKIIAENETKDFLKHIDENFKKENYEKCIYFLNKIIKVGVNNIDLFIFLGNFYYKLKYYEKSINYYKKSLQIDKKDQIYRLLSIVYYDNKNYKKSFENLLKINDKIKEDLYLIEKNKKLIKVPFIIKQKNKKQILEKPILCIYTGYHTGSFNGRDFKDQNGVYGSEISAIYLAEQLRDKYKVFIFCNITNEIVHNDVCYINFQKFNHFNLVYRIDIMIISRFLNFFHLFHTNARKIYLWLHDARAHEFAIDNTTYNNFGINFYNNILSLLDGIICVSEWQKKYLTGITNLQNNFEHEHKIHVIGNGFNPENFKENIKKIPNKFIYCSDPSRGLDILLDCFPKIKEKIKDATLDIYFGNIDNSLLERIKLLEDVEFHGKIPENILCNKLQEADIFFYPNRSHETFCINALNAMRAKCIIVCRKFSGLIELVEGFGYLINNEINEKWKEEAVNVIITLLTDENYKKNYKNAAFSGSLGRSWKKVSEKWYELFKIT